MQIDALQQKNELFMERLKDSVRAFGSHVLLGGFFLQLVRALLVCHLLNSTTQPFFLWRFKRWPLLLLRLFHSLLRTPALRCVTLPFVRSTSKSHLLLILTYCTAPLGAYSGRTHSATRSVLPSCPLFPLSSSAAPFC